MSYSNPISATYRFPAASTTAAAVVGRIAGPKGKTGRLVGAAYVITTGTTVTAPVVHIGSASDADAYGILTMAIGSANDVGNTLTMGAEPIVAADTVVNVSVATTSTAGAADLLISIDWS